MAKSKKKQADEILATIHDVEDAVDMTVDDLPGIGDVRAKRLKDAGIFTVMDLSTSNPMEVKEITGLEDLEDAVKCIALAKEILVQKDVIGKSIMGARELLDFRSRRIEYLTTGAPKFDKAVMGGGIQTESLTEFFGLFGSGKTQEMFTIAVTCQRPKEEGGLDGSVIWIDTEGTFRPNRIIDIAVDRFGCTQEEGEKYLDNIVVIRAHNSSHQLQIIDNLSHFITEQQGTEKVVEKKPRLLIIDSLTALFRTEYLGRGTLQPRQSKMGAMLKKIGRLVETWKMACVFTNQVMSDPGGNQFVDPIKPVGGNLVGHLSTYRLYIKKSGKKRIVTMIDSPEHAEASSIIALDIGGFKDAE